MMKLTPQLVWRAYGVLSMAIVIATLFMFLSVYVQTTMFGLQTGSYEVTIDTNHFGENYAEIVILCSCIPYALLVLLRTVKRLGQEAFPLKGEKKIDP